MVETHHSEARPTLGLLAWRALSSKNRVEEAKGVKSNGGNKSSLPSGKESPTLHVKSASLYTVSLEFLKT